MAGRTTASTTIVPVLDVVDIQQIWNDEIWRFQTFLPHLSTVETVLRWSACHCFIKNSMTCIPATMHFHSVCTRNRWLSMVLSSLRDQKICMRGRFLLFKESIAQIINMSGGLATCRRHRWHVKLRLEILELLLIGVIFAVRNG